jgi:dephospho-CoA kinase
MKSIAITGSFASGKSFVLKYLEKLGYKIFSCDEYVKQLYLDSNIQAELINIFDKIGTNFDKKKLAEFVFNDNEQRKKLEKYIHPKVIEGINKFKDEYNNENIIFTEVPLLFETGFNDYFDYSICVYCDEDSRKKKAKMRNDFNLEIYNKIKNIQLPQKVKKKLANFQINTDMDIEFQISKIIDKLNEY